MREPDRHRSDLLALIIIAASVLIRMLGIARPLLGNFGDYQAGQAMVAKFFVENHFTTLLYPQTNVLVNGAPSLILLYYPVSSLIAAILYAIFGGSLDLWGRLQAVLFFAASSFCLYRLVVRLKNEKIGLGSLIVFSLSPLTVIYGQSFQNEMASVFFSIWFFYNLIEFLDEGSGIAFVLSSLSLSGILVTRPNALYLLIPAFYFGIKGEKDWSWDWKRLGEVGTVTAAGLIIPMLWNVHVWRLCHISRHIYMSIFPQLAVRSTFLSPIIFGGDYYRLLFDAVAGTALTPIGITLLMIGALSGSFKDRGNGLFMIWCLSFLGSSLLIPRKLIDHNFYLLHLLIPTSPFIAQGFVCVMNGISGNKQKARHSAAVFVAISFLVSMRYAVHPAFKTPRGEQNTLRVAKKLEEVTDRSKSRVIVQGTRTFLYYADRFGWASFSTKKGDELSDYYQLTNWQNLSPKEKLGQDEAMKDPITYLEYLRKHEGATDFVVTEPAKFYSNAEFSNYVVRKYPLVFEEKNVALIFRLNQKD